MTHIRVPGAEAELAADMLWQAGASAVVEHDEPGGDITVIGDVDRRDLPAGLPDGWRVEQHEVVDDGFDGWRPHARAERAGKRIVVQPPWVERDASDERPDDVVVLIDPERAFGSGSHVTTRLVLARLERALREGDTVLDVGCGSGVLSIVAAKLGASSVTAVDIDSNARRCTAANAIRNDVADRVHTTRASVEAVRENHDVVLANISAATLRDVAPLLVARASASGTLVLSGFLEADASGVAAAFPACALIDTTIEDGWACLVLRAPTISGHAAGVRDGAGVPRG